MYHHPLASFLIFVTLFMTFEMVSALTLWVIAAVYTSSTMAGLGGDGLAVEDNFRGTRQYTTTTSGEEADERAGDATGRDLATEGEEEDDEDDDEGGDTETETDARQRSRQSLAARDQEERYEARRAAALRDMQQGRLMTAVGGHEGEDDLDDEEQVGLPQEEIPTQARRVLGRLDEETEEETDFGAGSSALGDDDYDDGQGLGARGWEDIRGDEEQEQEESQRGGPSGLRRRKGTESVGPESTIGGVSLDLEPF